MRIYHHHYHRKMNQINNDTPLGVLIIKRLVRSFCPQLRCNKEIIYKTSIFGLTYLAYICYHMSRKPISVVKSVLQSNCSTELISNNYNKTIHCGYAPFDGSNSASLFAMLDGAFLFAYAGAMFMSGFIAERVSLRYFLALGMITSGICSYLFGIAKTINMHYLSYFVIVQVCAGIVQSTGWPGVVTLVGRWFGKAKRGLIFGIWNSHTSMGNILGTLIAANYVESNWSLSFIVPGIIIAFMGFILFLFVVDNPTTLGFNPQQSTAVDTINDSDTINESDVEEGIDGYISERSPILAQAPISRYYRPIGVFDALYIPGVLEFSLCLFFSKLVSYTFLYWLPLYIKYSNPSLSATLSANISTVFDVGGIFGAIIAGLISDHSGMPATTCVVMLSLAAPLLYFYQQFGALSVFMTVFLLVITGFLVNGPYALITTSVSAELGQHSSLGGNAKALATVTAIIDGTGSIGAAIGPLMAGLIANSNWQDVFYMLILSDIFATLLLIRLVQKELRNTRLSTRTRIE